MKTTRYAGFLRGVSPMNLKMPELKKAVEHAGFADVKTVLSSGNVVFDAPTAATDVLEQKLEKAMRKTLGKSFVSIVRSLQALREILDTNPYARFRLPAGAKRVVTFLREPPVETLSLPVEVDGARILAVRGCEVFTAYVPSPRGAVFMKLIEKTFGDEVTTRTWDTVRKVANQVTDGAKPRRT